ncbi:hypothetical protein QN277_007338 [Acacia crassicarpa]|uniref:Epidermal patterning factor-like protein n=1 Tax=Acacia crassicarpa TaxID=499986 RepID=A0AAE1M9V3_9FABA|nr:hypothetical protein QN277_007338 [Acacia crassicarpa]
MTMKRRRTCSFIIILMATLLSTTLANASATSQVDQTTTTKKFVPDPGFDSTKGNEGKANGYEEIGRTLSRLGSIPPRCEHKCRGCAPCDPIQIPTTSGWLGVQYTNYEPEGWKCKCGTAYFNP